MATIDLKKSVLEYVNTADVRLLKMIKALAESYENDKQETSLSNEHYKILEQRREAHLQGKSKSLTWEQVKQNARKAI